MANDRIHVRRSIGRNPSPSVRRDVLVAAFLLACCAAVADAAPPPAGPPAEAPRPTLHVVSTAHLDTQWLWTIQDSITECVPATLRDNFELFKRYPDYVFNFEGSFRYRLAKEYYPKDYARLVGFARAGRWHASGSSIDAGDVNIPAPESLIRHVLLANRFYRRELGQESTDIFLPDCFGFGWALPTVAAHCGLKGFSTQKLTWGSSVGIPFDVGAWEGVDGSTIVAALDPGEYVAKIREDLSVNPDWLARATRTGETSGAPVGYRYYGTGDRGGAPDSDSVAWLAKSIAGKGPLRVLASTSDRLYADMTPEQIAGLPRWTGELLMTRHGVGCYTSQAAMKRLNRQNEQLAAAAERAAVAADWLGGAAYPGERLREAWIRFLWHHHHDDITGTSTPLAYPFSWNDEYLSQKDFAAVLTDSIGAVARGLDTRGGGAPLIVFNPLSVEREDVVEARVRFRGSAPPHVRVYGPDGDELLSQEISRDAGGIDILVLARVPPVGFAVLDVRTSDSPCPYSGSMYVTDFEMTNGRLRVTLDPTGDVAQVEEIPSGRKNLSAPLRLQLLEDAPDQWSEWEISWEDIQRQPRQHVGTPTRLRIVERGPVRVAIEVSRHAEGSRFRQQIRLASGGAGQVVEIDSTIDWQTKRTLLKAAFPLAVAASTATYDLGIGVVARGNNSEALYEVPAQQWADVTAPDGSRGVAILSDCKTGWDKPSDDLLRLSLIHSPLDIEKDMGGHRFRYGIAPHAGDWRGGVQELAARFNAPLVAAWGIPGHAGALGKSFSMLSIDTPQIALSALKMAEDGDEVIVRLVELHGRPASNVGLHLASPVLAVRDVTGQETGVESQGAIGIVDGDVRLAMEPYRPRTLALRLASPDAGLRLSLPTSVPVALPFDTDVASADGEKRGGDFDGLGHALPAELLPAEIVSNGIRYVMGPTSRRAKNAVTCRGQSIPLPPGGDALYVLMAASGGDVDATFRVGEMSIPLRVPEFTDFVGQSQSLVVDGRIVPAAQMEEPFLKREPVAWIGTHRHDAAGANEPYVFCYLFESRIDLPADAGGAIPLMLPDDDRIKVLAASIGQSGNDDVVPAGDLLDDVVATRIRPKGGLFIEPVTVTVSCDRPGASIRYTLDGRDPGPSDPVHLAPIPVAMTTTVRARAFFGTRPAGMVAARTFTIATPRPALTGLEGLEAGLSVECFEGEWRRLADMAGLTPVKRVTARDVSLVPRTRDLDFGLRFSGFIDVPRGGVYTFTTRSDDGSTLAVGGMLVVDNDGLHGATERSGSAALAAGKHAIAIEFFQRGGDLVLEAKWEGPGLEREAIPAAAFWRSR